MSLSYKATRFDWRYFKARINPPASERKFKQRLGWRYYWYGFRHQYRVWVTINGKRTRVRLDFAVFYRGRKINFECDGRQHESRYIDDQARDWALIRGLHWEVYRIPNYKLDDPDLVKRIVKAIRHNQW